MHPLLLLLPAFYFYRLMCFDNNEHQSDICHYKSNSVNNLFWQILNFIGNLKCFNLVGFDVKLFCSSKAKRKKSRTLGFNLKKSVVLLERGFEKIKILQYFMFCCLPKLKRMKQKMITCNNQSLTYGCNLDRTHSRSPFDGNVWPV